MVPLIIREYEKGPVTYGNVVGGTMKWLAEQKQENVRVKYLVSLTHALLCDWLFLPLLLPLTLVYKPQ